MARNWWLRRDYAYYLSEINRRLNDMQAALERLATAIHMEGDQGVAIIKLVEGLAQQIRDNVGDPTALTKLADEAEANAARLAASTAANTPSQS